MENDRLRIITKDKVYNILNNEGSIDDAINMPMDDFVQKLIDNKLIASVTDVKLFILEGLQKAYEKMYDFPIRYYKEDEDLDDVEDTREYLTDDYVDKMKTEE